MRYILSILLIILFFLGFCQSLSISEVFYDGSIEWIEIVNTDSETFSGTLMLSGAKSSPFTFPLNLEPGEFGIITDEHSTNFTCAVLTSAGLVLSDTKAHTISLYEESLSLSGTIYTLLDIWFIPKSIIDKYNDTYRGIYKQGDLFTGSTYEYEEGLYGSPCGLEEDMFGDTDGSDGSGDGEAEEDDQNNEAEDEDDNAEEGDAHQDQDEDDNDNNDSEEGDSEANNNSNNESSGEECSDILEDSIDSDTVSSISRSGRLYENEIIISQIYPYDDEFSTEYILLESNIVYSGGLIIGGLGHGSASKVVNRDFTVGSQLLVVDEDFLTHSGFTLFQEQFGESIGLFVIPSISLTDSGQTLTIIDLFDNEIFSMTYVKNQDFDIFFTPKSDDGGEEVVTPSLEGLRISEVHAHNSDKWGEYIEFTCISISCKGTLSSQGLGRGSRDITFPVDLTYGQFLVVFSGEDIFPDSIKKLQITSLSLKDSGDSIILYGQNGQVIDTVVYPSKRTTQSIYFEDGENNLQNPSQNSDNNSEENISENSDNNSQESSSENPENQSEQNLDNQSTQDSTTLRTPYYGLPSPGISQDFCQMIYGSDDDEITHCSIEFQHSSALIFPRKINLAVRLNDKRLSNTQSTYSCSWTHTNTIDSGTLSGCNPLFVGFTQGGVIDVGVEIRNEQGPVCKTTMQINYPQLEKEDSEPNRTNYYKGLYDKRKERHQNLKKAIQGEGYSVTGSEDVLTKKGSASKSDELVVKPGLLSIVTLLPDPVGKDDKEVAVFYNHTQEDITEKLYLKATRRRHLNTITIPAQDSLTLTGSLGLVNRPACITLQSDTIIYDRFCYGEVEEGKTYTVADRINQGDSTDNQLADEIPGLGQWDIIITSNDACLRYDKETVSCKALPVDKDTLRELKAVAKKYESLEKRAERDSERLKKTEKELEDTTIEFKVFQDMQKTSYRLLEETFFLWRDKLIENDEIYTSQGFRDLYTGWRQLDKSSGRGYVGLLPVTSVREWMKIYNGNIPLTQIPINTITHDLYIQMQNSFDQFIRPFVK